MEAVPKIGDKHHFFDDGKMRESRHYIAEVLDIIKPELTRNILINRIGFNGSDTYMYLQSLHDIWREEVNSHRNSENFKVLGKGVENKPGAPWCYAEETDYFVKCSIPNYDEHPVWFVRHVDGGWFSIDAENTWMGGKLMPVEFDWNKYQEDRRKEWEEWLKKH